MSDHYLLETDGVCIIPNVQKFQIGYKVALTNDDIFLVHKGGNAWIGIVFQAIGGLLFRGLAAKSIRKAQEQTAAKRQGMSYEDIVIQDPKSVKIPFSAIEKYEVKKGVFSGGADFAGTIKGSIKPTILWVNGKKNMVFLTKEDQEKMEQILMSRCPGRIK